MKNKLFQNFEHVYDAIKFLGIRGVGISLHFIFVSSFYKNRSTSGIYKFSNLAFKYTQTSAIVELFSDIFTLNPYFFECTKDNPTIIDIGANTGDSLMYFKYLYPKAKVFLFEPHPVAFSLLQDNIRINHFKDVKAFEEAISARFGSFTLFSKENGDSRQSSSDKKFLDNAIQNKKKFLRFKVKSVPMSQKKEILKLNRIDLLKIDAEGYESQIVSDLFAHKLLRKVDKLIIEYHFMSADFDNSLDNLVTKLRSSGFKLSFFNYYRYLSNTTDTVSFIMRADR